MIIDFAILSDRRVTSDTRRDEVFLAPPHAAGWPRLAPMWSRSTSVRTVAKLVAFYVDEHNMRLPHSAFRGQTPDEMYFGTGSPIPDELEAARTAARQSRMAVNRTTSCPTCERFVSIAN